MITRFAVVFALLAGVLANSSPLLGQTWIAGNGFWNEPTNWSTGMVPGSAGSVFINSNASNVIVSANGNILVTNLTIDAGDQLTYSGGPGVSGFSFQSIGGLTNNGLIHLRNGGSPTTGAIFALAGTNHTNGGTILVGDGNILDTSFIYLSANATLTGGGTVMLNGSNTGIFTLADGGGLKVLTIANQTIEGFGQLGANNIGIINQAAGLVDANSSGNVLLVGPSAFNNGMVNQGTMQASGGGILELTGNVQSGFIGDFNNAGGVIRAQAGSEVRFSGLFGEGGNATVFGGIVESLGTGLLRAKANTGTSFRDLTINGNMIVEGTSFCTLGLAGSINNTGNILVNTGPDNLVSIQGDTTLTGGGSITLGGTGAAIGRQQGSPVLTIANETIEGHGPIGQNSLGIINHAAGVIDANVAGGVLTLDHPSTSQLINQGTLRASNGGQLIIQDSFSNDGLINAGAGSLVDVNNILTNGNDGIIMGEGELEVGGTLTNNGTIAPGASTGMLTIDFPGPGVLVLTGSSVLEIELESTSSFDVLDVAADATLGGSLVIDLSSGFVPAGSDMFPIMISENITGGKNWGHTTFQGIGFW